MSESNSVCGIIVTYCPNEEVLRKALRSASIQADQVVLQDNSPSDEAQSTVSRIVDDIRREDSRRQILLVRRNRNDGLSRALNAGIQIAVEMGFRFVLLLDQDSVLEDGAIESLKQAHQQTARSGCVTALITWNIDENPSILLTLLERLFYGHVSDMLEPHACRLAITSGLFLDTVAFRQIGLFDEGLFLDGCDHDFSLRLRKHGGRILVVPRARIRHSQGSPTVSNLPGLQFNLRYQDSDRLYYMTRDSLRIASRYWTTDPLSCLVMSTITLGRIGVLALVWPHSRVQFESAMKGVADFLSRCQGERKTRLSPLFPVN